MKLLPVHKYETQVYGQDIFRQQGLILNFNILHTFCNNVMKFFKVGPLQSGLLLHKLTREAFDSEALCIQAVEWYNCKEFPYKGVPEILTRISVWPLHEPVLSSYDDRKEALFKRCKAHKDLKSDVPENYTIRCSGHGEVTWHNQRDEPLPTAFHKSRHFQRVMNIVQNKRNYGLYPAETDPSKESNWVYYIVMLDPTVSPVAADQGYIGETSQSLVERMKQHARGKAMIIHHNLALISQYAQQRGENLSKYAAVFALGTTPDSKSREDVEGKLIRESLEGNFSVTNMKYGMNDKQGANNPNAEKRSTDETQRRYEKTQRRRYEETQRRRYEETQRRRYEETQRRYEETQRRYEETQRRRYEETQRRYDETQRRRYEGDAEKKI